MSQPLSGVNKQRVPEPTLRRLPWYLSTVKLYKQTGEEYISSTQIAKEINMDPSQTAKDLSFLNIAGRTRVGYQVDELIGVLERFLGFTSIHQAVLFGVGNLGGALLQDKGLQQFGLQIVAAFDVKESLVGKEYVGVPVYHTNDLKTVLKKYPVSIGVLTVPIEIAQEVTDLMVASGIKAIWNFTPFRIRVPQEIVVQNTSIYSHLALMFNRLNTSSQG